MRFADSCKYPHLRVVPCGDREREWLRGDECYLVGYLVCSLYIDVCFWGAEQNVYFRYAGIVFSFPLKMLEQLLPWKQDYLGLLLLFVQYNVHSSELF